MAQFIVAIGLVLVIEGLLFAAFPRAAKRLAASALESPETSLRIAGLVSAVLGLVLIWIVRGCTDALGEPANPLPVPIPPQSPA
jgi:uncharacterized protein YjeT (DUF2065 family)